VIPGPAGAPLLYAGVRGGLPAAVLAFQPRRSDLPLQVAFPVLLANLAGELLGGSRAPADALAPGSPVTLPIPDGAIGVRVERPDGVIDELMAPVAGAATVTFARTELLGVYTVTGIPDPNASPSPLGAASSAAASPSGGASASPGASPSASPSSSGAPAPSPTFRPADPGAPVRFAVDLLDVNESTIAPGDPSKLSALGRAPASPGPSASGGGGTAATVDRPNARDELWIPVVLVALVILTLEWLVYERDTVARLRRSMAARLGRGRPAAGNG
jgi:hypothetical protein